MRSNVSEGDNLLEGDNLQDYEELYDRLIVTTERILEILKGNIRIFYIYSKSFINMYLILFVINQRDKKNFKWVKNIEKNFKPIKNMVSEITVYKKRRTMPRFKDHSHNTLFFD
jgi:hypothetical protein